VSMMIWCLALMFPSLGLDEYLAQAPHHYKG
jgi:hypothetical protein